MAAIMTWRTASRSANGDCVQARWRRSTRSNGGSQPDCVEARAHCGAFDIRDSKLDDASPVFSIGTGDFRAFLQASINPGS